MSAAPVRIIAPGGEVVRVEPKIAEVSALPAVWDLTDSIEWLVDGMIPRASVNLISAESGTGKTWLTQAISGAVAHGKEFLGRPVQRAPVLYLDGENPLYVVKRNLKDLGVDAHDQLRIWGGWNDEEPPRPDDARITSFAEATKPLLVWDSLVEFARCDEQSSTEMREFMKLFRRLAHVGATVIVLHHTGKSKTSKDYRGSTDIKASVDMAYVVSGHARHGKLHRLEMNPFKSRIAPGQKFAMEFREGRGFDAVEVLKQSFDKPKVDADDVVRTIVRQYPGLNGAQIKEMAKERGVGKHLVEDALFDHDFVVEPGPRNSKLYTLRAGEPPSFPNPRVQEAGETGPDTG